MTLTADIATQTRPLGRTGFSATRIGIGDLADRNILLEECVATARRALDFGLNLIDTAPGYEDGYSEEIVGKAIAERREGLFVIDKIDHFDRPVGPQVEGSLKRLGIEHADAFVLHGLSTMEAWNRAVGPGDLMDQLAAEIKAGKARFRGISCHNPEVLRVAIPSGLCDVVMFPVGAYVDERYVIEMLPLAKEHGVGVVAFKTFGAGKLLGDTEGYQRPLTQRPRGKISSGGGASNASLLPRLSVAECVHYTLTCDPDVALLGMSFPNEQDAALAAARNFRGPLSESVMADIRRRAVEAVRGKGPCWWNPNPHEHA
jgi:aryl-alcohol dehydrogenase-like predicted oxidoreductase